MHRHKMHIESWARCFWRRQLIQAAEPTASQSTKWIGDSEISVRHAYPEAEFSPRLWADVKIRPGVSFLAPWRANYALATDNAGIFVRRNR